MANIFRYNKFQVYGDSLLFSKEIRELTTTLPKSEEYSLKSQMTRAADSVVLNIAEGVDRYTNKDFGKFLNQAIASLSETASGLDICLAISYISETSYKELVSKAEILYKKLNALHSKITKSI
jgi:four helix bundle protein